MKGDSEDSPEIGEKFLQKQIDFLRSELKTSSTFLVGGGTYAGQDEPPLDVAQNQNKLGQNLFWHEFSVVFPNDLMTRYTCADQISVSFEEDNLVNSVDLYNKLMGLSPFLSVAFTNSGINRGLASSVWNSRLQLINSKRQRSGVCLPKTYPLLGFDQYLESLELISASIEDELRNNNHGFFGNVPSETIARYRGHDWGFQKLCTDQAVRFNLQSGVDNRYLELRCIDSQESVKATAALCWLVREIVKHPDLSHFLPTSEEELRHNFKQAYSYGINGHYIINCKKIGFEEYSKRFSNELLRSDCEYSRIIKERLEYPANNILRAITNTSKLIRKLESCLLENKTLYD